MHIQFDPKFDGLFETTLELVFYDSERLAWFLVSRGIGGSLDYHKHCEFLDQGIQYLSDVRKVVDRYRTEGNVRFT